MIRRMLGWGLFAFALFFIAVRPASAQDVVLGIGGTLQDIARALGNFFTGVTGG